MTPNRDKFNTKGYFAGRMEYTDKGNYLILAGGDVRNKIIGQYAAHNSKAIRVIKIDGIEHTVLKCKAKFLTKIENCGLYSMAYCSLASFLTETDIKNFFYELWRGHHNSLIFLKQERKVKEYANRKHKRPLLT